MTLEKYQMTNLSSENTLGVQQKSATRAPLMMPMGKTARKIDLHPIMRDAANAREREPAAVSRSHWIFRYKGACQKIHTGKNSFLSSLAHQQKRSNETRVIEITR